MNISELLTFAVKNNASDLHISTGLPPMIRVDGDLRKMNIPSLDHVDIINLLNESMDDQQRRDYEAYWETDFAFEIPNLARFRVNAYTQSRGAAVAFRIIPSKILSLDALNFPDVIKEIANYPKGLVLVTGPTGSGKSTTLAAIIDTINSFRRRHIITIEDPIEFIHESKECLINQRQVHRDTRSFSAALRSALREDPDIILVGELRDLETIRLAMSAAETGHLVLGTLHTNSATTSINRIIDVFPGEEKSMIRSMLSESLQAVIGQRLLKKIGGGRVASLEVMICNAAIRNLIREDKIAQMYSTIQTGQGKGMQTLDQHLTELVNKKMITPDTANEAAVNKSNFQLTNP